MKEEAVEEGQENGLGGNLGLLAGIPQAPRGRARKEHFLEVVGEAGQGVGWSVFHSIDSKNAETNQRLPRMAWLRRGFPALPPQQFAVDGGDFFQLQLELVVVGDPAAHRWNLTCRHPPPPWCAPGLKLPCEIPAAQT